MNSTAELKTTKLRPLFDKVLVKVNETPKEVVVGGIVLPDNTVEKPMEGTVIAVGLGRIHPVSGERIPIDVAPGQTILFGKYSGNSCVIFGEEHLMLSDTEILGCYFEE